MNRKIVAIGGGEIGRTKVLEDESIYRYPVETLGIEQEIIRLSGKDNPHLLFLPTASNDSTDYVESIDNHFGRTVGCRVHALRLVDTSLSHEVIKETILTADIIYVGGGHTTFMLETWKQHGVDHILRQAFENGIVLSGVSAGAVCWFQWYDNGDERELDPAIKPALCQGLGILNGFAVPHADDLSEDEKKALKELVMQKRITEAWAVDNFAAIIYEDGKYRTMRTQPEKDVRKLI